MHCERRYSCILTPARQHTLKDGTVEYSWSPDRQLRPCKSPEPGPSPPKASACDSPSSGEQIPPYVTTNDQTNRSPQPNETNAHENHHLEKSRNQPSPAPALCTTRQRQKTGATFPPFPTVRVKAERRKKRRFEGGLGTRSFHRSGSGRAFQLAVLGIGAQPLGAFGAWTPLGGAGALS